MQTLKDIGKAILKTVLLTVVGVATLFAMHFCDEPKVYTEGVVMMVGGCDKKGWCGVLMEDGSSAQLRYPVVGQHRRFEVSE